MSEWSNVPAWKASIVKAIGGSNPLLSAKKETGIFACFLFVLKVKGEDSKGAPPKAEKVACGKFLATDRSVLQSITRALLFALQNARRNPSFPPKCPYRLLSLGAFFVRSLDGIRRERRQGAKKRHPFGWRLVVFFRSVD